MSGMLYRFKVSGVVYTLHMVSERGYSSGAVGPSTDL